MLLLGHFCVVFIISIFKLNYIATLANDQILLLLTKILAPLVCLISSLISFKVYGVTVPRFYTSYRALHLLNINTAIPKYISQKTSYHLIWLASPLIANHLILCHRKEFILQKIFTKFQSFTIRSSVSGLRIKTITI